MSKPLSMFALALHATATFSLFWSAWFTELFVSFLPQFLALGAVLHLAAISIRRSKRLILIGIGSTTLAILATVASAGTPQSDLPSLGGTPLVVTTYNNFHRSTQRPDFRTSDILGIQEIRPETANEVAQTMGAEFLFIADCQCSAAGTEVALVSRYPILSASTNADGLFGTVIRSEIDTPDGMLVVYVLHVPPPESRWAYERRNYLIDNLASSLAKETGEYVVMGDFNTVAYSPVFRSLIEDTNATAVLDGLLPSCTWYGFGRAFCLRIDHILTGGQMVTSSVLVDGPQGSDHRALSATVQLPPTS